MILRNVSLTLAPGERVALMGRNGAGKSTLLRHAAGLQRPSRGRVRSAGRVALLLQNPNDYLIHERAGQEASAAALTRAGLDPELFSDRHPRELSGGERQRLALAIVLGDGEGEAEPAACCASTSRRGAWIGPPNAGLAELLTGLDQAVIVATHDPEFAAAFAERVILLADGAVIVDAPAAEALSGGSYFVTETARILSGRGGALTPDQGSATLLD